MRLSLVAALLIGSALPQQAPQMSHEETVVRTTYARLAFAVQVNEVHLAIREAQTRGDGDIEQPDLTRRLKDAEIKFILSDFKVGNVTDPDIGKLRYEDLVTKPSGDTLDIGTGDATFVTDEPKKTRSAIATVRWQPAQNITEDWGQTWSSMLPRLEHSDWLTRYASFAVKVTFAGRSREYRGLFVFGRTPSGAEYIVPVDTIAGLTGGLDFFITRDAYPEALIEGHVGKDIPAVRNWLTSQAVSGKKHSDNCDPATLKCGISQEDINKIRTQPISRKGIPRLKRAPAKLPRLEDASFRLTIHPLLQAPTSCAGFSTSSPHVGVISDASRHSGDPTLSNHALNDIASTSCTYSDGTSSVCNTVCNVNVSAAGMLDNGDVTGFCHKVDKVIKNDTQNGTGAGVECGGGVGGGVKECLGCLCGVTISVSGSGASVSFNSDGFFTANDALGQRCAAITKPTPIPTPTPPPLLPPPPPQCDPDAPPELRFGNPNGDNNPCDSPIIIDTGGNGYHLTSAANGVMFDISGSGTPMLLGWTTPGSGDAFLALPRPDGMVVNGTQLFGNFTPQPPSDRPNGYTALAVYDQPDHGGNGDRMIDQNDQIFSSLRLWLDENHDGICQPGELHTLPELGVFSISLSYSLSHRVDDFGNVFRYRANINSGVSGESGVGRKAYDVFLTTQ